MAVKCSLLTLSCALDGELPTAAQAELESHLVSCERCKIGLQYLREETERIANLPRIHLPGGTVDALLQRTRVLAEAGGPVPAGGGADRPLPLDETTAPDAPPVHGPMAAAALPEAPSQARESTPGFSVEVRGRPATPDAASAPASAAPTPPPPPSAERLAGTGRTRADRAAEPRPAVPAAERSGPAPPRQAPAPSPEAAAAPQMAATAAPETGGGADRPGRGAPRSPRRPPRRRPALLESAGVRVGASAVVALAAVFLVLHAALPGTHTAATRPTTRPATHPRPSTVAATPAASPAAASPTAAPSPTARSSPTGAASPAAPGIGTLPALTGTTTLGGAATGYTVQTARYGEHANGLWVVFQLIGSQGAPRATVGFAGATTLDVELQGVRPGTPVPAPQPGLVVTGVTAGGTGSTAVYTLHLTRAVQVGASYLPGSLTGPSGERLILILH